MALDWRAKLKALLDSPDEDDAPAEVVAESEELAGNEVTAADDPGENPEPVGLGEDPTTEPGANPEGGNLDEAVQPDAETERTLPDGDENPDSLRDSLNNLAVENEALRSENDMLRSRVAELGGDAALGISEEVVETPAEVEGADDEYDADADIAEQQAQIKKLKGDSPDEND